MDVSGHAIEFIAAVPYSEELVCGVSGMCLDGCVRCEREVLVEVV